MFSEHTFLPTFFQRYAAHGPTFQTNTLGIPTICSCEPDNLRSVFSENAWNWGVSYRLPALDPYCGKGFLTTDGKEWERSRGLFSGSFAKVNVKDYQTYESYVQKMFEHIPRNGETVDLQPLIFSLYLDTSTLFLFGESFESLSKGLNSDAQEFVDSFAYSLGGGGLRMALGPLRFLHWDKKWQESNKRNHAFIEKYVDAALERKKRGIKSSEKRPVLLNLMAEQMDDRIQLRNEATQAFVAAHETTACLISNVVFLLARYPDAQARVRDEVRLIGDKALDFDVVLKMKYLQNVISESRFARYLDTTTVLIKLQHSASTQYSPTISARRSQTAYFQLAVARTANRPSSSKQARSLMPTSQSYTVVPRSGAQTPRNSGLSVGTLLSLRHGNMRPSGEGRGLVWGSRKR